MSFLSWLNSPIYFKQGSASGTTYLQRVFDPAEAEFMSGMRSLDKQNAFNAEQAQLQRDFEERMSSTAYSRAVDDLKRVGINPYAFGAPASASTPSGVAASSGSGSVRTTSASSDLVKSLFGTLASSVVQLATRLPIKKAYTTRYRY